MTIQKLLNGKYKKNLLQFVFSCKQIKRSQHYFTRLVKLIHSYYFARVDFFRMCIE